MELFDTYDENGKPTGEAVDDDIVHAQGLWHKNAHIWIMNDRNQILLQKRSAEKKHFADLWMYSAAGHLSAGETSIECAIRETGEEIGIDVTENQLEYLYTTKESFVPDNNEFNDIYLLKLNLDLADFSLQESEVADLKWIDFAEFTDMVNKKSGELVPQWDYLEKLIKCLDTARV